MSKLVRPIYYGRTILVLACVFVLSGCAATQVALGKKDLLVNTKMSDAIFVREVPKNQRSIYVKVRSAVADFPKREFRDVVKAAVRDPDEGYTITDNPETATYVLNIFVTNMEQASPTAAEAALGAGYTRHGGAVAGAAAGIALGGNGRDAVAGGLLGAIGSTVANSLVKDVTFMLVTDILITHKFREGVYGRKDTQASRKQGSGGSSKQSVSEVTDGLEQTTRVVTTANKANLTLEEAKEEMFRKHSYAISGFF
ncbi:MAG: complement resistance protein TraT [Pseudomonadales bacterium]|jgi:hypothetical protein|nr:complement resistance protein TraT [Pseudomonadales bacterium]